MNRNKVIYFFRLFPAIFMITCGTIQEMVAQDWEGTGEIEEAEVIIEKDVNLTLPNASRLFERVPEVSQSTDMLGLTYTFEPIRFNPSELSTRVRPLTLRAEPLPAIKNSNVKAGFGNYQTPFLEANFGNGRNDEYLVNLFVRHRSSGIGPVDGENSADSENIIDFNGNIFLNKVTLTGEATYERDGFTFYGYDRALEPVKDDIQQVLHQVTVSGRIHNNLPESKAKYSLGGVLDYVQDRYSAVEADFGLNLFGRIPIKEDYNLDIVSDFNMVSRKDSLLPSFNRLFLRVKPYINFTKESLEVNFGLNTVMEDDTLGDAKQFHIFPYLDLQYNISKNARVYAGYKGDVDKRSLKDNLNENRYLSPNIDIFHKTRNFDVFAGLKGSLGNNWSYDIGAELVYYKNRGYFVNSAADTTRFDIVYDTGTGNSNYVYASLGYNLKNKIYLGLQEHHYFYNTDNIQQAWHLPSNDLTFVSSFIFGEKIKLNADAYLMSGIQARDPSTGSAIPLKAIIDVDLGLEYLISNQASIFVNSYNIIGNEYERFLNYPNRGLQILAGLSYSF